MWIPVLVEREDDSLTIWLNRPGRHNAFSTDMRQALLDALTIARVDTSIRDVTLAGTGPSFCSGGDLAEFGSFDDPATAHFARTRHSPARALDELASRLGERLKARVHGQVVGSGLEMAAFCGRIEADPQSRFGLPELALGLIPGRRRHGEHHSPNRPVAYRLSGVVRADGDRCDRPRVGLGRRGHTMKPWGRSIFRRACCHTPARSPPQSSTASARWAAAPCASTPTRSSPDGQPCWDSRRRAASLRAGQADCFPLQTAGVRSHSAASKTTKPYPRCSSRPTSPTIPWAALAAGVAGRPAAEIVARARLLDMPAAVLGEITASDPKVMPHDASSPRPITDLLVADLSSMWAGPLCGRLLAAAGATVVKVETAESSRRHPNRQSWLLRLDER